ncbi:MAG: PIN domain-containing protein [Tepidisphaeraceae bacterium]|jgi:predicted nucleic acid-binding protein
MRIYLDVSCLDRPFDDQWQSRIRLETEAIAIVFHWFETGVWQHVSSEVVLVEIAAMPDLERRRRVSALLPDSDRIIALSAPILTRAESLIEMGFKPADAAHVAAAEAQRANVLLTCDDRLVRLARRMRGRLAVEVDNPLSWIRKHEDAQNT